jgi:hypothetical protein
MDWIFSLLKKPGLEDYIAAGCIFTNQTHVLAALQTKRGVEKISGLGGMKKTGESCERTALRETLEELFELPKDESEVNDDFIETAEVQTYTQEAYSNLEKIENALPQVRGLEASDTEMDELAELAKNSYKDLMDLGMQVDSRFASEIFNSAGTMLGHAITAKTAKINKKLKMIDLQMKKAQLDHKISSKTEEIENTPLGEGNLLDRNELLRSILASKKT